MSENLSIWSLIVNAGVLVQFVMLLLFLASVFSWFLIAQRFLYFRNARVAYGGFEGEFWSGIDLSELYRQGNVKLESGRDVGGIESIFRAGFKEFSRLRQQVGADSEAVMYGAQRAMRVALNREHRHPAVHSSRPPPCRKALVDLPRPVPVFQADGG